MKFCIGFRDPDIVCLSVATSCYRSTDVYDQSMNYKTMLHLPENMHAALNVTTSGICAYLTRHVFHSVLEVTKR